MAVDFAVATPINCGSAASLDNLAAKTITFFLNTDGLTTTRRTMIEKWPGGWSVGNDDDNGTDCIVVQQSFNTTVGLWRMPTNTLTVGVWYHVAISHSDRTSTSVDPVMYLDGVSQTVTEVTTPAGTTPSDAAASVSVGGGQGNYDGRLADVRVFNRVLTAQEVAVLASGYAGPMGSEVLWLSMRDFAGLAHPDGTTLGATNILWDMSGNGNDGTPAATLTTAVADEAFYRGLPVWVLVEQGAVAASLPPAVPPSPPAPPVPDSFRTALRARNRDFNLSAVDRDDTLRARDRDYHLRDGQREVR